MKRIKIIFIGICITLLAMNNLLAKNDWPVLKGPYLGQKPPGLKAEIFAPGIISTNEKHDYFSDYPIFADFFIFRQIAPYQQSRTYITQLKDGQWTKPRLNPFENKPWYYNYDWAKPGEIIYFSWRGPFENIDAPNVLNIWRVKRTHNGWSRPIKLPSPVNSQGSDTWPSVTKDFDVYFFSSRSQGFGHCDIYRTRPIKGKHINAKNLGRIINTRYDEVDPYIAPDGSFLLYCSDRPGGFGRLDIYIAYKTRDGSWSQSINVGKWINTAGNDERPYVTLDQKYLFFTSNISGKLDIHWVSAKIIKELKPKDLK